MLCIRCSEADRGTLLPGLNPLVFCNASSGRITRDNYNSVYDMEEAADVAKVRLISTASLL
eukprot:8279100-Pyramimonas_sp.AAC.1